MVILIASDQSRIRRGIADRLREKTSLRVLTAATVPEMEVVPMTEGALDLLLFSPVFSAAGKEARARLRVLFPEVRTVLLDEGLTLNQLMELIDPWLESEQAESLPMAIGGEPAVETVPETLGDYDLIRLLSTTEKTLIYLGTQQSVRREVAVEQLRPELAADQEVAREFRRMVRARALVSHPAIAAVYEAQEVEQTIFYTRELVRGENLEDLSKSGTRFPEATLLQMLLTAGEAFQWMEEHEIHHGPVSPSHLYLGPHGTPRIANIAQAAPNGAEDAPASIASLLETCLRLVETRNGPPRELSRLVSLLRSQGPQAIHNWKSLSREARLALQRLAEGLTSLVPESTDRIRARRRLRRRQLATVAGIVLVGAGLWAAGSWWARHTRAKVRDLSETQRIPAGEFIFRNGQKVTLPEYDIDKFEVTLAEYRSFLDALPQGDPGRFDHPDQPASKAGHQPGDWKAILSAASSAGSWLGHPITLNAPVFNVDWWDAWAYARFLGRRLPTEEEWEKAARGPEGMLWPWGNDPDPRRANTGVDYANQPSAGGQEDGHAWWCDADAMPGDVSPYGVHGMGGNVAEWTESLVPDPGLPDVMVPVFRGSDFHQTAPVPLNAGPWVAKSALYSQPFLGFRTVSARPDR